MKRIIFILIVVISFACKREKTKPKELTFEIISSDSVSLGYNHHIRLFKSENDNNKFLLNYSTNNTLETTESIIDLTNDGEIINNSKVNFNNSLTDYVKSIDGFYTIETLRVTMGKSYTHNYLCKYDNKWNKIWEKELKTTKFPAGNSFIYNIEDKKIILISDAYNGNQYGLIFEQFDFNGNLISSIFYKELGNPYSVTKTSENNILISSLDEKSDYLTLFLSKINGEILWKSTLNESIVPKQIKQLRDNSFILIGTKYVKNSRKIIVVAKLNSDGKILWKKELSKHYYEEAGNFVILDNNYLFSACVSLYKDGESFPYIFEINKDGKLISEKRFDFELSNSSTPLIIKNNKYLTMVSLYRVVDSNDPSDNYISINRISKTN
ncbi:hypothetical protein EV195_101345 [Tenacibaculum skagerrakense]|uniref:Pyrroloquinoline-quinone binding quinoprotein n=1 Tax=Tenacibaculum skagerrakense TaxID=186571 RepID=A0A4R2P0L4_9FLAO|nr:hypothetical protein [Tenacibaculum skagerrakense]TCP28183.1 hypothetical protein EV195_101345 [Tenacibaculum skagerrakense]